MTPSRPPHDRAALAASATRTAAAVGAALALLAIPAVSTTALAEQGEPGSQAEASDTSSPDGEDARLAAATQVVERLHDSILDCMKNAKDLGFDGRYEKMDAIVAETFDLPFMARSSIGKQWRALDVDGQRAWLDLSRRLSATNYAYNFDGWSGERFETVGADHGTRDTVRVRTKLVQELDPDIRFDYRLRERDGAFRVIDIQLDGTVSELALRRADYTSTIDRSGYDQLVTDLEKKIDEMSSTKR